MSIFFYALLLNISINANAAASPNPTRADNIFDRIENGLVSTQSEIDQLITELEGLIAADDTQRQHRLVRTKCWNFEAITNEQIQQAIDYASEQILLFSDPAPSIVLSDLYLCRGWYRQVMSKVDEALSDYNIGIEAAYQLENPRLIADGRSSRGSMFSYQGNFTAALEDLITAQQLYESLNIPYWASYNLGELASTYRRLGDSATALKYQLELEQYFIETNQTYDANEVNNQIAFSLEELGEYQQAIERYQKSRAFWLNENNNLNAESMSIDIAGALIKLGQFEQAKTHLLQAETVIPESYDGSFSYMNLYLAQVFFDEDNYDEAIAYLDKAIKSFAVSQNSRGISTSLKLKSDILGESQQWYEAYQTLYQYVDLHIKMDKKHLADRNAEMQTRFDTNKIKNENLALIKASKAKQAQLEIMQHNKNMQIIITILSLVILILVSIFAYKQILRKRSFKQLALTDELTGLANRRFTYDQGDDFIKQAKDDNIPFSIISFDADHFKQVNDNFGHDIGDKVLVKIAELAVSMMRDTDIVGRVGGEEYIVLLPNISQDKAIEIAHRLIDIISTYDWSLIAAQLTQTVSAGVASFEDEQDFSALLVKADKALYLAKNAGRNCVKSL
ncbi:tetratricopeptide repeat-containing diguanylate cyclase [Shewanella aestuarii]|uniref:diguanylate cyclase n=1 Tax=Shewanella aestuarii TaxID=1028752 RepID=A0A6G9QNN4_9GAMM|nr:tetratricopeptide repeat-containing diguanylate cyclase [Shewanella aestuarii]QIR15449.1 diguanylate cyclase [Shewanella aestuarii]